MDRAIDGDWRAAPSLYRGAVALAQLCLVSLPVSSCRSHEIVEARGHALAAEASFSRKVIDATMNGDVKAIADIDGDGHRDLVMGGRQLVWYRSPGWTKTVIASAWNEFTTDMQAVDVDRDGRVDLVVGDGPGDSNLAWWKNNGPGQAWTRTIIGTTGDWVHDLEVGDLDGDGRVDVLARRDFTHVYYQNSPTSWIRRDLSGAVPGGEGLGIGDVDADGDLDFIAAGRWYENPRDRTSAWTGRTITNRSGVTGLVSDINADGRPDVAFIPQHVRGRLAWYSSSTPRSGPWTEHVVAEDAGAHKLNAADMNGDGRLDFVAGLELVELAIFYNDSPSWRRQVLSTAGTHNARVADLEEDGDMDIFGANYLDHPPVELWLNQRGPQPPAPDAGVDARSADTAAPLDAAADLRDAGGTPADAAGPARPQVRINFQPPGTPVPANYLADTGAAFGPAAGGFSYGWLGGANAYTRDRGLRADQRYDTLNHLQKGAPRTWAISLPNGAYRVRVVAGDPGYTDQVNTFTVGGVQLVDPDGMDNFDELTANVNIVDGQLTIAPGPGASNAKLCFVEVDPI